MLGSDHAPGNPGKTCNVMHFTIVPRGTSTTQTYLSHPQLYTSQKDNVTLNPNQTYLCRAVWLYIFLLFTNNTLQFSNQMLTVMVHCLANILSNHMQR